ncbi:MAG: DUF6166 domain-containing protein [Acidobacteriaceae bacterium]
MQMLHSGRIQAPSELCSQTDGMFLYRGSRIPDGGTSVVRFHLGELRGSPLPARTDLKTLSFNGLSWGTRSPESGQLALALLCDVPNDDARALRLYPHLCDLLVQNLSTANCWILTDFDVRLAVESIETAMGWDWAEKQQCYADQIPV